MQYRLFLILIAAIVGAAGCGIFITKMVMMIASIASKNVSNRVVSILEYLLFIL